MTHHEPILGGEETADLRRARPASVVASLLRALATRKEPPKGASLTTLRLWHLARTGDDSTNGR